MPKTFDQLAISGTRMGLSIPQAEELNHQLRIRARNHSVLHHGNALGVDIQAEQMAAELDTFDRFVVYPATTQTWQVKRDVQSANEQSAIPVTFKPRRSFAARNRDLVAAADLLIACPEHYPDPGRSGTWHAIRTAIQLGKHVIIISRDGDVHYRRPINND